MCKNLDYRVDGSVARIEVAGTHDHNRLSREVLLRMREITGDLKRNPDVHVVTLRGAGEEYFSAGILTPELKAGMQKDEILDLVMLANEVFDDLEALPQIVICGLNGIVRAGAVELMLACDIRIAATHVRLSLPEAKWGIFPAAGAPVRLPLVIGAGRALELICTGREIDSSEMERIGLVNCVVAKESLQARMDTLAQEISDNGPMATRGAKRIVSLRTEPGFRAAREMSDALRYAYEWTQDAEESVAAHKEGRRPRFSGR